MTTPTSVSAKAKIGVGTETQMNFGTEDVPEFKVIPGLLSSGDWGYDQEFVDDTPISELDHTSTAGDRVAKEILLTLNHMPGNEEQKSLLDLANVNDEIELKKVYSSGFVQSGRFLLSLPYYTDPTRSENSKVSIKGSPQGGITDGTVV